MKIDILTLFPKMFTGPFDESIIKRAQEKEIIEINIHNLRKWATDKHKTVDDRPFGGGAGMVLKVEPVYRALKELEEKHDSIETCAEQSRSILMTPQGKKLEQNLSKKFSTQSHLIIICGHYEGIDERIRTNLADYEISIGDYVLTGGELPSMVFIDSIVRLIPGVVGKEESIQTESFQEAEGKTLLEYPQYTQPAEFETDEGEKWSVPEILLSGHHANIERWRKEESLVRTKKRRPDLL